MLRIIGGKNRGRQIEQPALKTVRPMTDRVREALFNLISGLIDGRPVYDFFAGSGAIGLEALSRGAGSVRFIESDPRVVKVLRANIETLNCADVASIDHTDAYRYLDRGVDLPGEPAVVFVAPPYAHFQLRHDALVGLVRSIVDRFWSETVVAIQAPRDFLLDSLPSCDWDLRYYGETNLILCETHRPSGVDVEDS